MNVPALCACTSEYDLLCGDGSGCWYENVCWFEYWYGEPNVGWPMRRCGETEEIELGIGTCDGTNSGSSWYNQVSDDSDA